MKGIGVKNPQKPVKLSLWVAGPLRLQDFFTQITNEDCLNIAL